MPSANGGVSAGSIDAASHGEIASSETNEPKNGLEPYTANITSSHSGVNGTDSHTNRKPSAGSEIRLVHSTEISLGLPAKGCHGNDVNHVGSHMSPGTGGVAVSFVRIKISLTGVLGRNPGATIVLSGVAGCGMGNVPGFPGADCCHPRWAMICRAALTTIPPSSRPLAIRSNDLSRAAISSESKAR
jgi:hypothetical protein